MKYDKRLVRSYEKRMIVENEKYWKQWERRLDDQNENIFVLHGVQVDWNYCMLECIVAKGLQGKENLPILSFQEWSCRKNIADLDRSFGIQPLDSSSNSEESLRIRDELNKAVDVAFAEVANGTKNILQITYKGIPCGDAIYDRLLRDNTGKYVTVQEIPDHVQKRCILKAFSLVEAAYRIFEHHKPKYVVTMEWVYVRSLFMRVAQEFGASIIVPQHIGLSTILKIPPSKKLYSDFYMDSGFKAVCEAKSSRISEGEHLDDYFVVERKSEWNTDNMVKNGKPNVFILPHALSDCPRGTSRKTIFVDYNDWLIQTLKIVKDIKNVNWYIKNHPFASFYRLDQYVRELFEQNKSDSMFWCDKEVSGQQIREVADCVITCDGNAGIEYWAYGVPTITASDIYYADWGISYNAKTLEEYRNLLTHIGDLAKPDESSVKLAQKYLYALKSFLEPDDKLAVLSHQARKLIEQDFTKGEVMWDDVHYFISEEFIKLLREDAIRKSPLYTLEYMTEVDA